ncbi:MAG: hypothetical protein UW86_C0003G0004 [Microgenomates group bacterium GW2011_GWA1_Microgenomates_45_10]|nr:MAG: hypothetical protein UW69_C0027G0004 [Microgenomates group bacterium GW2011_GWA2_44_7]KKT77636.1 MAG: hypothetical protein UW73_C0015G0004 [Microgenomates group bacterium GW2011_GWB1_44_8]KKT87359.1 MAG: hypothetical protein UW86_C0003G0004 [Microgenomates group bacterium GW2011_GWA1_Microgenomates_45_10]
MEKIKIVQSEEEAKKVVDFLTTKEAFELEMNDFRQAARKEAVFGSLSDKHRRYWYCEDDKGKVTGAIGVAETERKTGGYYIDYFAVHKDFRRLGIGSSLLQTAENFVKECKGRFILIDTGDTDLFTAARAFYLKNGYTQVGHIPEYSDVGDGRIDLYKKIG